MAREGESELAEAAYVSDVEQLRQARLAHRLLVAREGLTRVGGAAGAGVGVGKQPLPFHRRRPGLGRFEHRSGVREPAGAHERGALLAQPAVVLRILLRQPPQHVERRRHVTLRHQPRGVHPLLLDPEVPLPPRALLRLQPLELGRLAARLLGAAGAGQRLTQRVVRVGARGVERDGAPQHRHRRRVAPGADVHLAEGRKGARVVGVEPHGGEERGERLVVAALQVVNLAERPVAFGASWD